MLRQGLQLISRLFCRIQWGRTNIERVYQNICMAIFKADYVVLLYAFPKAALIKIV
jgi:hypothetical protein